MLSLYILASHIYPYVDVDFKTATEQKIIAIDELTIEHWSIKIPKNGTTRFERSMSTLNLHMNLQTQTVLDFICTCIKINITMNSYISQFLWRWKYSTLNISTIHP